MGLVAGGRGCYGSSGLEMGELGEMVGGRGIAARAVLGWRPSGELDRLAVARMLVGGVVRMVLDALLMGLMRRYRPSFLVR